MTKGIGKLLYSLKAPVPAYGPLAACCFVNQSTESQITVEFKQDTSGPSFIFQSNEINGNNSILRSLQLTYPVWNSCVPISASLMDYWLDFAQDKLYVADFKKLSLFFDELDNHLTLRSFFVGYHLSPADFAIWGALKANAIFNKQLKTGKVSTIHLSRWYTYMNSLECVNEGLAMLEKAKDAAKDRNDKGSMEIALPDAFEGKVVTRFPPEPSGYLHIGHAKAALLNDYFAKAYKGKLLVRFDDTNPSKEKLEFEQSIKEDLLLLGIKPDQVVHTSDHFEKLYELALKLIKKGLAYVDDTDVDTMRNQRFDGIESKNRSLSVEKNLELFEEMRQGTTKGLECCLRAKIDMQDKNKCMRDPVIYRCNQTPHHVTGTAWKMYPTYDFACPLVDSIDGVTHALRTIEYRDRNPQYEWFLKALEVRKVHVWDFSRISFIYTLLSKRKLTWFVEENLVNGWDDPRFPTVRGIRRRGMTIDALRNYIIAQGASQRELNLEWDKIWALNKKIIDPISPRYTALLKKNLVPIKVLDSNLQHTLKPVPKHKKNPNLGTKTINYGPELFLEQQDCSDLEIGEEVTFMDWGNVIVKVISRNGSIITGVTIELHLEGDFKKTKKKLTWLGKPFDQQSQLCDVVLFEYDYLISKKKLEEDDDVKDFLNPITENRVAAVGDANLRQLKVGDIIQIERKGYYICDKAIGGSDNKIHLILIPDGKSESVALKNFGNTVLSDDLMLNPKGMYQMNSFYEIASQPTKMSGKMYAIDSIYGIENNSEPAQPIVEKKVQKEKPAKPKLEVSKAVAESESLISKLDIVVGKVVDVKKHPDADSLYVEMIDVGEAEPRQVVSGLVKFMQIDEILGKEILVLKNLKPVAMRGIKSYAMVLCASDAEHTKVEFLIPPAGSVPGDKVFFEGHVGTPEPELKPKKKVWETVQPDFTTGDDLLATWKGIPFQTSKGFVRSATLIKANIK